MLDSNQLHPQQSAGIAKRATFTLMRQRLVYRLPLILTSTHPHLYTKHNDSINPHVQLSSTEN